jgi:DNA-binding NarL/FixJ family response regulator
MKEDAELRKIPVTVLTTSKSAEDVARSYKLGVNSFIIKPVTFDALVNVLNMIGKYWFEIVELPL